MKGNAGVASGSGMGQGPSTLGQSVSASAGARRTLPPAPSPRVGVRGATAGLSVDSIVECRGERRTIAEWSAISGVPARWIRQRIAEYDWPAEAAIFVPVRARTHRLTRSDVVEIRAERLEGRTYRALARRFGISSGYLYNVCIGVVWK